MKTIYKTQLSRIIKSLASSGTKINVYEGMSLVALLVEYNKYTITMPGYPPIPLTTFPFDVLRTLENRGW